MDMMRLNEQEELMDAAYDSAQRSARIPALRPYGQGYTFVCYGDCCSGIPGMPHEASFAAVNAVLAHLSPHPDFICFLGDHVLGQTDDYDQLRAQWHYWRDQEMAWHAATEIPMYHITSNHTTYDVQSEAVWREMFADIPPNGPHGQKGLSYYVRHDDLLLVFVNTSCTALGGYGHVEHQWLDQILSAHTDAPYKLVIGHHPIHPVNGYEQFPLWRVVPEQGAAFWDVLVNHDVCAYICSHIIAFDVQVHAGVLQITSGGAGTCYGPGGAMPGPVEYEHLVQGVLDDSGLRYQVLDTERRVREWLQWPFRVPHLATWDEVTPHTMPKALLESLPPHGPPDARLCIWRCTGVCADRTTLDDQTLTCGWDNEEGPAVIWIGLTGTPPRVTVRLVPMPGFGQQLWHGPYLTSGQLFDVQIAIHTGMGPGGVLWYSSAIASWSSLQSSSARGAEALQWPNNWAIGHHQNGINDRPFQGTDLHIRCYTTILKLE